MYLGVLDDGVVKGLELVSQQVGCSARCTDLAQKLRSHATLASLGIIITVMYIQVRGYSSESRAVLVVLQIQHQCQDGITINFILFKATPI